MKAHYQPDWAGSVICGSYTLIIACIAMLFWLEITVLQIYTIISFIIFFVVVALQYWRRYFILTDDELQMYAVIKANRQFIKLSQIEKIEYHRFELKIATAKHVHRFLMTPQVAQKLQQLIKEKQNNSEF